MLLKRSCYRKWSEVNSIKIYYTSDYTLIVECLALFDCDVPVV